MTSDQAINIVHVRWHDGYFEAFRATEVRFSGELLWLRLASGENRQIPLIGNVRWWSMTVESHATTTAPDPTPHPGTVRPRSNQT
jgi:hypothetical protein